MITCLVVAISVELPKEYPLCLSYALFLVFSVKTFLGHLKAFCSMKQLVSHQIHHSMNSVLRFIYFILSFVLVLKCLLDLEFLRLE
jgi:hypothetical protein